MLERLLTGAFLGSCRDKLANGVFDLNYREPAPESIKAVMAFSRKTGDYASLSAVDIRVIALAHTLEREIKGTVDHLRAEPARSQVCVCVSAYVAMPALLYSAMYV